MISVQARGKDAADILIHEHIGADWFGDGLTSKKFAQDLAKLEGIRVINLRINSEGGSVVDGLGIYNTLAQHPARINVIVEGLAASMASAIAMVGDHIVMAEGALMMIHSPWSLAMGNAEDMRKAAEVLDMFEGSLLDIYSKRTGMDRSKLAKMLAEETWMNGASALENGFADEAASEGETAAAAQDQTRSRFVAFASAFRQNKADISPLRIAAVLKSELPDATGESHVTIEATASVQVADIENAARAATATALAAEAERRRKIRESFGSFTAEHQTLMDACLEDMACSVDDARAKLLAEVGKKAEPIVGQNVINIKDAREKFIAGAEKALLARAGFEKREAGNEYNGKSLADLAGLALAMVGVSTRGMTKDAIARKVLATHSTSDFPLLMANTAGRALIGAYREIQTTWQLWAKTGSVPDFKVNSRLALGSFSNLLTIPEGSEYKQGTLGEEGNNLQALTKGRYIQLTRQLIVNDDLGAFTDLAAALGRAARRTVEADVYTSLTSNSGAGPTMADTGALFNATAVTTAGGHANLTSSGTALSVASLNVGNLAMRAQKDKSLNDFAGIRPKFLLVPPGKEYLAWELINSVTDPSQSNPAKRNFAQTMNLTVISSDYLSGNAWYLIADPNVAPLYEVAFLDGNQEPFIDEEVEFLTDALRMKVRLDYGVAPIDFRAGYRNAGA
jgi:ATP-dependent protease ClpP protease subunit